ncbi:uncharacterized protein LOC127839156 [Dreissena polymorpha]|nr:uncharacterized protein LOC127839156 [Dreissena polymorpha]
MASDRPMSETTILRKHALYQTSYVENRHVMSPRIGRSQSPARNPLFKKKRAPSVPSKTKTSVQKDRSPPPLLTRTRLSLNQLDARRLQRLDRQRPWQEKPPKQKKTKGTLRIFYDKTLPTDVDTSDLKFKARKYVSNSKYGDIYMIREINKKEKPKPETPPRKWLWEDEYMLWMATGSRDKYLEDRGSTRTKAVPLYQTGSLKSSSTTE